MLTVCLRFVRHNTLSYNNKLQVQIQYPHNLLSAIGYYRQDLPQVALPVLFLLTGRFLGFSPYRATRCTVYN